MKIQYLGHSCFRLISQTGTAIITDPYDSDMVGLNMPRLSCDVVTISHHHRDHDFVEGVKGNPALLEQSVAVAADDVAITSIPTYHDNQQGKLRGENHVFCFLVDGLKVVHMGDVGEIDDNLVKQLHGCDVLMLPVGGVFTIDAIEAKKAVDKIQPKIVIPMHYKTEKHKFGLGELDQFTKLFDDGDLRYQHSETLILEDMPENTRPQVVVLDIYED